MWQRRLADAQMEYLENAPALLQTRSINYLSLFKARGAGSRPSGSIDSGSDSEIGSYVQPELRGIPKFVPRLIVPPSLWQPRLISPKAVERRLCNHEVNVYVMSSDPPAKELRSRQRLVYSPLQISSKHLWKRPRPRPHVNSSSSIGLWGSKPIKRIVARQKPPRKSKRVTFLPDIGTRFCR